VNRARPIITLIVILATLAACGATARERTIQTTLTVTNAARDGWITLDEQVQDRIIERATSREQGEIRLAAYRVEQDKILVLFEAVYRAIATASVAEKDEQSLRAMLDAARRLKVALDDLKKEL